MPLSILSHYMVFQYGEMNVILYLNIFISCIKLLSGWQLITTCILLPLVHLLTPPLFHKLKVLTIFDIFKLQLGKLIYESVNNIGPTNKVIIYTMAPEIHSHNTRYAKTVISIQIVFELPVMELRDYKCKVNIYGKIYQTISKIVEQRKPSLQAIKGTLLLRT